MDLEQSKRRQSLRILISEIIMVLAVVVTVIILAFIVSGYWVNSDFKIERQGLLQVASVPTGADVKIDGSSSWLQRTNTSKVLKSGTHEIELTKEGYDSWSKIINIAEGLLYRLNYPRLFLNDRKVETVMSLKEAAFATVSPNRERMLIANSTTEWELIELNNDNIISKSLDVSGYFTSVSMAPGAPVGLFTGTILNASWDKDSIHVLLEIDTGSQIEWTLLDVRNITSSLSLTSSFGLKFDVVKIIDNSSNKLLALQGGNLRQIDISGRLISSVIASGVQDFDYYNNEIIVTRATEEAYTIEAFKLGDDKITTIENTTSPARVAISRFYDEKYFTILIDSTVSVYQADDLAEVISRKLSFTPTNLKVGHGGNFVLLWSEHNLATLDMESLSLSEWQLEDSHFGWLDGHIIYTVTNGELIVYDYDGLNRRALASNVSSRLPATITADKWLYYFSDNNLVREWLIPH